MLLSSQKNTAMSYIISKIVKPAYICCKNSSQELKDNDADSLRLSHSPNLRKYGKCPSMVKWFGEGDTFPFYKVNSETKISKVLVGFSFVCFV